ncbi:MAG: phosphoribosylaminoimidazolesuccinocarboxamide synthase [Planctomycetes bacterium]|nr:phosphoribosylaminoimidazolesuccinocarboxamide synthase [Planctomycetota bacterium]
MKPILKTDIPVLKKLGQGKVRDIYEVGENLLVVTTDRISAFDVVLPDGIPYKGAVLTALSTFWFYLIKDITPTHFITSDFDEIARQVPAVKPYKDQLVGRTMLVKKATVFPVECVVRGYIAGSAWEEYSKSGTVRGVQLVEGLKESDQLKPTPSTKAEKGHDENISFEKMAEVIGPEPAKELKDRSIRIYETAHKYALTKGIIICDTKFEWGTVKTTGLNRIKPDNPLNQLNPVVEITLVDEVLTPDSSRFWPSDGYFPGKSQPSFDKQFVRDYLKVIGWNKTPPAPKLPEEIIKKTSEKYLEAYKRITGQELA